MCNTDDSKNDNKGLRRRLQRKCRSVYSRMLSCTSVPSMHDAIDTVHVGMHWKEGRDLSRQGTGVGWDGDTRSKLMLAPSLSFPFFARARALSLSLCLCLNLCLSRSLSLSLSLSITLCKAWMRSISTTRTFYVGRHMFSKCVESRGHCCCCTLLP